MEVKKTCKDYREQRGDYEISLKEGESVIIRGYTGLVVEPDVTNVIRVKCKKDRRAKWCDKTTKREIEIKD